MDGTTPADQAYTEDVTDLREALSMIAHLWRAVEQHTKLTYDDTFLPQQRQLCALPGIHG